MKRQKYEIEELNDYFIDRGTRVHLSEVLRCI